jgi:hypothetical protein
MPGPPWQSIEAAIVFGGVTPAPCPARHALLDWTGADHVARPVRLVRCRSRATRLAPVPARQRQGARFADYARPRAARRAVPVQPEPGSDTLETPCASTPAKTRAMASGSPSASWWARPATIPSPPPLEGCRMIQEAGPASPCWGRRSCPLADSCGSRTRAFSASFFVLGRDYGKSGRYTLTTSAQSERTFGC